MLLIFRLTKDHVAFLLFRNEGLGIREDRGR